MAGRKKSGELGRVVGVRFDKPIQDAIDQIARQSPMAKNAAAEVVRVVVTNWLAASRDPLIAFEELARAFHVWRSDYVAGLQSGFEREKDQAGKAAKKPSKRGKQA